MVNTNLKLYSLVFIDSLCLAFLPPIMATHLFSLGGSHTLLGRIGSVHAGAQLLAGPILHWCSGVIGRRTFLSLSVFIYFLTYYFIGITTSLLVFVLLRALFALTNQTQSICKGIASDVNAAETKENVINLLNIVAVAGLVVAPIISGWFFDNLSFYHVTITGSALLGLSFGISLTLAPDSLPKDKKSFTEKLHQDVVLPFSKLCATKHYNHLLLLKALYMTSLSIFFIKFSMALRLNHGVTYTAVGLTYSYQSLVTFLSTFLINYFSPRLDKQALLRWLFILGVTLTVLCNTHIYLLYISSFIVMAIAHGVVSRLFRELFAHNKLSDIEESITKVISVVIPAVFGFACDFYGLTAFNAFVILPIFCDIFIVYKFITIDRDDKQLKPEDKLHIKRESKSVNKKAE